MDDRGDSLFLPDPASARQDGGRRREDGAAPGAPPSGWRSIVELAQHRGRHQAETVAFRFLRDGEAEIAALSYGELDRRARLAASALARRGAAGERVLLVYPQGLDFVVAFFAVLYAGAVAVPAPQPQGTRNSAARLAAIAADARPRVALTTPALRAEVAALVAPGAGPEVATLDDLAEDEDAAPPVAIAGPRAEALALLQYTSGSTGTPRGVMISHASILHNQELIRRHFEHSAATVTIGWLPMFHDMGLFGTVVQPVYLGASAVLMSPVAFLQDPARWLGAITRYRGTTSGAPNFAYDFCVDRIAPERRGSFDLACWDAAFNGAEPVRAATLDRFAAAFAPSGFRVEAFYPCYGMAEATLLIAGGAKAAAPVLRRRPADPAADATGAAALVGCGRTGLGQQLVVVDPETCLPLPDGRVGELWLAGPSVGAGYWNRPDDSRLTFGAELAGMRGGRFLRTGDLGLIAGGEVFVTGRIKDVIIVRGRNHYPQEIEATVQASHADLRRDCGAAFMVEEAGREKLVVVQELARHRRHGLALREIAGAIRAEVAREHGLHVATVVLVGPGGVAKTTSGKIRRSLCRARYLAGELPVLPGEDGSGPRGQPALPDTSHDTAGGAGPMTPVPVQDRSFGVGS